MKIKKLLSLIAAAAMTVTATVGAMTASATDASYFTVNGSEITGYTGTDTDIVLPTEIDGVKMTTVGGELFYENTVITSVVVPEGYTALSGSTFRGCTALKSISLPETLSMMGSYTFRNCPSLESVNIPSGFSGELGARYFQDCTNPNLVIDIQSLNITSVGSNAFLNVTGTINVYSQAMYDLIAPLATTANVVLNIDKFVNLKEALAKANVCKEENYTAETYSKLTEAVTAGNAVLANENATDDEINSSAAAINEALNALAFKGFTELDEVLAEAEDIVNNHENDYTADSIQNLKNSIDHAKQLKNGYSDSELTATIQAEINSRTSYLRSCIEQLVEIDKTPLLNELKQLIEKAEALDSSKYTEESFEKVTKALESAKTITEESTVSEINTALSALKDAMSKISQITEPAGDPFVNVYKNGAEAKVAALTADESIAGTTKIKLTFDCASDVSYNPNASIEVKTVVSGTESYEKFIGTDGSYKNGTTDWTVELPLTSEIKSGDSVNITAYTYAWKNASDYVYAIKKVDFVDSTGYILKTMTDRTVAQDKLAEAIAKAEGIKADDYTAESYASVTEAVKAAKALKDEATAEEINTALTAIKDAVKALTYKPADYTKVDEAIAKIPADLSKYTDESVKALNTAKEAVDRSKNITEQETVDGYAKAINDAISALKVKPTPTKPNTTNPTTKATRSKEAVKKDKSAAKKAMKQAKISKLKVKSKAKKKINVSWKKVKKAKGYQVQVSAKKNFKKVIFKKDLKKTKLTIKNKKIKSKKTYYVRVRAYATYKNANNKTVKVYSKWNKKLRKVTVK